MYRIYRKLIDPFQGDFEFCMKNTCLECPRGRMAVYRDR